MWIAFAKDSDHPPFSPLQPYSDAKCDYEELSNQHRENDVPEAAQKCSIGNLQAR